MFFGPYLLSADNQNRLSAEKAILFFPQKALFKGLNFIYGITCIEDGGN